MQSQRSTSRPRGKEHDGVRSWRPGAVQPGVEQDLGRLGLVANVYIR